MPTALAILFLVAALFSAYELIRFRSLPQIESYIADREAHVTHLLMNGGMAVMLAPFYGPATQRVVLVLFGLGAAALAARLVFSRTGRSAGTAYHLFGLIAMIYAAVSMPGPMAGPMHHGMAMAAPAEPTPWLATALGALFALDGVATAVLAGVFPRLLLRMEQATGGASPRPQILTAIRLSAFPHVVMDIGMAWMLIGMR